MNEITARKKYRSQVCYTKRMRLKKIAKETMKITRQGYYEYNGRRVELPEGNYSEVIAITPEQADTARWSLLERKLSKPFCGNIYVWGIGSFGAVADFDRFLVLNFANAFTPGGGFLNGAEAQEESLCRESTLYASLSNEKAASMYEYNRSLNSPAASDYMLLSPEVCVFRAADTGKLLDKPYSASVLTVPAVNLNGYAHLPAQQVIDELMYRRIENMLAVAIEHKYKNLILGAWGCGAFGHDARRVAAYFYNLLVTKGYRNYFDNICFAVLDDEQQTNQGNQGNQVTQDSKASKANQDNQVDNLDIFAEVFADVQIYSDDGYISSSKPEVAAMLAAEAADVMQFDYREFAINNVLKGYYPAQDDYVRYNFPPAHVSELNIGYAYGVTRLWDAYMAEQWGCHGDKSVCFYLSDIHDIWCSSYEDRDKPYPFNECSDAEPFTADTLGKGHHVFCRGMRYLGCVDDVYRISPYLSYLVDRGLLEFLTEERNGYVLMLKDADNNSVVGVTVALEKAGELLAKTPLAWKKFPCCKS
ncbi:MAG: TIGR02452 family protein [Anaerovibrio sp.]